MSDQELVSTAISRYMDLLRIEAAENRDAEIETQKRELCAILKAMGVAVENLQITK